MKKNLVALLLVLAVVSVGVFADPPAVPAAVDFDIVTTIDPINAMKFTNNSVNNGTYSDFTGAVLDNNSKIGKYAATGIPASELTSDLTLVGYLSIASNYRLGVKINMTASAMVNSDDSVTTYIPYKIALGSDTTGSTVTSDGLEKNDVFENGGLSFTNLNVKSTAIKIKVEQTDLDAALVGDYTGTVTFNWVYN
ncbi:MAG: hypothetical protein BWY50_00167 [Spirochaetes bacterium ADurb.Bin315]|jgi:hypothetical protein|nr:MAG: hypothetical protein BWY50_00167 [Spirochaetes bacterium ADurb.Bin315]